MRSLFADLPDIPIAFNIITWKITNDVILLETVAQRRS